jgi:hypothetical protein
VKQSINIILFFSFLYSVLIGGMPSSCYESVYNIKPKPSCCNTQIQKSCCCIKSKQTCACLKSSNEDQTLTQPVQYVPSIKPIQTTVHAFYLNAKQFSNFSFDIIIDHIRQKLSTEVQKILPLLN